MRPLHREKTRDFGLRPVIEEDVSADIEQVLRFADVVLDRIDPTQRLTHLVPVAALLGSAYGACRTRAEHAASQTSMAMNIGSTERPIASLSPPARSRQAFRQQPSDIAQGPDGPPAPGGHAMTAPTIEEARAAHRINGAMATVLRQVLEEARFVERGTYALPRQSLDGGHRQRVLVATDLGLFDWSYDWPRHEAWAASAILRPRAEISPVLSLRARQSPGKGLELKRGTTGHFIWAVLAPRLRRHRATTPKRSWPSFRSLPRALRGVVANALRRDRP